MYKSTAYRNRIVVDPRGILKEEFGTPIPDDVEIRVMDSTADIQYLVIPVRPEDTEDWSEEALISLVNRDSRRVVYPASRDYRVRHGTELQFFLS